MDFLWRCRSPLNMLHIHTLVCLFYDWEIGPRYREDSAEISDKIRDEDCLSMMKRLGLLSLSRLSYCHDILHVGRLSKMTPHLGYPIIPALS
jgi:hypothetical protein